MPGKGLKKKKWPYISQDWIDRMTGPLAGETEKTALEWQEENYPFYKSFKASVGLEGKKGLTAVREWGRGTTIESPSSDNIYIVTAYHWTPSSATRPFNIKTLKGETLSYEPILNSPKDDVSIRRVKNPEKILNALRLAGEVEEGKEAFLAGNDVLYHETQEEEDPALTFIPKEEKNQAWIWQMPVKGEVETEEGDIIVNFSPGREEGFYPLMRGHSGSAVVNSDGEVVGIASALKSSPVGGETFQSYISRTNPARLKMLLKGADQVSEEELTGTLERKYDQLPKEVKDADKPAIKILNDMGKFNEDEMEKISDTVQFWFSAERFSPLNLNWPEAENRDDFLAYRELYMARLRDKHGVTNKYGERYLPPKLDPEETIENYLERFEEKTRPIPKRNVAI